MFEKWSALTEEEKKLKVRKVLYYICLGGLVGSSMYLGHRISLAYTAIDNARYSRATHVVERNKKTGQYRLTTLTKDPKRNKERVHGRIYYDDLADFKKCMNHLVDVAEELGKVQEASK